MLKVHLALVATFMSLVLIVTATDNCGPYGQLSTCAVCQPTCKERNVDNCEETCEVGCRCKEGYIRLSEKDKTCVAETECPSDTQS